ncbi:hypothetical protein A3F38_00805 [Candidatus Saccharibacteria bacterium RIFCSPHIGHO2_12_FULL_48_21]|nr:MAG: hypothetical protein A3F38_00805 [Candidatus Saccharibacteria bacterium RIFCSPHIGHO2_12_FULL_48_21]
MSHERTDDTYKQLPLLIGGREYDPLRPYEPPTEVHEDIISDSDEDKVFYHLGRLSLRGEFPSEKHRDFLHKFMWVPYSKQEMNSALDSLPKRITKASKTKKGSPTRAVKRTFGAVDRYRSEAVITKATLSEALTTLDEDDFDPSPELIRQNPAVRETLAIYLLAKEEFYSGWKPHKKNKGVNPTRQAQVSQFSSLIMEAPKDADEHLVLLWREAYGTNGLRLRFWAEQVRSEEERYRVANTR